MLSTTSYAFSNDARATAFRRAVRSGVARRQGYAVPGSGASAQEVQRAYLRYCAEQQSQGQSGSAQQALPPYMLAMDNQAPPAYSLETQHHTPPACTPSAMEQAPPPYTSTPASEMTPTAQLDQLLYSNISTPPSSPDYTQAISALPSPPSYENVVSACTPTTSRSINTMDQTLSRTSLKCQSQSTVSTMSLPSTGRDHLASTMIGVVLTGHGGFEKLQYRKDLKIPSPGPDEVLIRVAAAGINNTDINTRIGWYSKGVETGTGEETTNASATRTDDDSTWSGKPLEFPRIQGADCCGHIVAVGNNVSSQRIGKRVLVRNMLRSYVDYRPYECWTFGSECDGAFAQYTKAPARETYKIDCDLSDTDLASVPCAWSTAENMLHRASVKDKENVLITGASGGVGAAAMQLAKRRGAHVVAIGSAEKADQMLALGADRVLPRGANLVKQLGKDVVDVVLDLVAGSVFPELLDVLKKGGRYAVAGAIAGPIVKLDVRTLYLKDLSFFGCTFQEDEVFTNLIGYIERGEIRPRTGKVYPLDEIVTAQQHFNSKSTCGKLVLSIP
ncbi:NAD(P)-binding protein, partial [Aureobasidium melanogenum]